MDESAAGLSPVKRALSETAPVSREKRASREGATSGHPFSQSKLDAAIDSLQSATLDDDGLLNIDCSLLLVEDDMFQRYNFGMMLGRIATVTGSLPGSPHLGLDGADWRQSINGDHDRLPLTLHVEMSEDGEHGWELLTSTRLWGLDTRIAPPSVRLSDH